jgi:hypothetical protein
VSIYSLVCGKKGKFEKVSFSSTMQVKGMGFLTLSALFVSLGLGRVLLLIGLWKRRETGE